MPQNEYKLNSGSYKSISLDLNNNIPIIDSANIQIVGRNLYCSEFRPTLRYGTICNTIRSNKNKINQLSDAMINRSYWSSFIDNLEKNPKEYYCSDIERIKNDSELEYQEGIVIKFPMFRARLDNGIRIEVRCSNTICIKPNFSKIWVGISFYDNYSKPDLLLDEFFSIAAKIAEKIRNDLFEKYKNALLELKLTDKLDEIYFISIEIIEESLANICSDLKSYKFSFKNEFSRAIQLRSIKWILNEIYRSRFDTQQNASENYLKLFNSNTDEWVTTNLLGKNEIVGLYLKQHLLGENTTQFRGVVHRPNGLSNSLNRTIVFSRDIIRNISPFIQNF